MGENIRRILCLVLVVSTAGCLLWGYLLKKQEVHEAYNDGVERIDLNSIYFTDSKVRVDFSEVILGHQEETRKLITSTQSGTISITLSDTLIKNIEWDFLKKTQTASYNGTGYFIVDLDSLTKDNIIDDPNKKTLTIKIGHAYLQDIVIDPDKILIGDTKQSLYRGDIKLTMKDYRSLEQEIVSKLKDKFNTAKNGQIADENALKMVKEIYEPIIKAIDPSYEVIIEFK